MKDCGTAPADTIFVGDQGTDLDAARKAGVAFGAVHWGYANIAVLRGEGCTEEFAHPRGLCRIA
jgi:phosphoglycolate phosphatase